MEPPQYEQDWLHELYDAGVGRLEIRRRIGLGVAACRDCIGQYKAFKAGIADTPYIDQRSPQDRPPDPTPEEIAEATAKIRATWKGGGTRDDSQPAIKQYSQRGLDFIG